MNFCLFNKTNWRIWLFSKSTFKTNPSLSKRENRRNHCPRGLASKNAGSHNRDYVIPTNSPPEENLVGTQPYKPQAIILTSRMPHQMIIQPVDVSPDIFNWILASEITSTTAKRLSQESLIYSQYTQLPVELHTGKRWIHQKGQSFKVICIASFSKHHEDSSESRKIKCPRYRPSLFASQRT